MSPAVCKVELFKIEKTVGVRGYSWSVLEKNIRIFDFEAVDLLNHHPAGLMGSFWSAIPYSIACSSSVYVNSLLPKRHKITRML